MNPKLDVTQESRTPIPDPTLLTTEALKTADANIKELLLAEIKALRDLLIEKIGLVEAKIGFTNTLKEEKFSNLREALKSVEAHRIEAKEDDAKTLEAALKAQEALFSRTNECNQEATAKSDAHFTKQIESLRQESLLEREGLSERINAMKERMDRGGGIEERVSESRRENRQTQSWLVPVLIIGGIALLNLVLNFINMVAR